MIENIIYYTVCFLIAIFASLEPLLNDVERLSAKTACVIAIAILILIVNYIYPEMVYFLDVRYLFEWAGSAPHLKERTYSAFAYLTMFGTICYLALAVQAVFGQAMRITRSGR